MPGRKQPEPTEEERTREYRRMQKRSFGDKVVGEEGAFLDELGEAARVARERQARLDQGGER